MSDLGRSLLLGLVLGVIAALGTVTAAWAHGENAQEGFLRMETVAFRNVRFSRDTIPQGEELTITGQATLLETWPRTLGEPRTGFINATAAGPVLMMKDRVINGAQAPDAIFVGKGKSYDFQLTLVGREPGRWHVHPTFAVEDAGGFSNNLTLLDGQTVNLETYGLGQLTVIQWAGFALGLAWMLYWVVPAIGGPNHRTVSKLPVTMRIPLNTDGQDIGLITQRDHRVSNYLMVATLALLAIAWVYQSIAFPVKIPQQVFRFTPPDLAQPIQTAHAVGQDASFDPRTSSLMMTVAVTNSGSTPVRLKSFTTSSLNFVDQALAATGAEHVMAIEPSPTIQPGERKVLRLTLRDPVWRDTRMIEVNKPRIDVAGQLLFEDASGTQSAATIASSVNPRFNPVQES
jgi:methane/ammonia monooxygenase subunit B